MKRRNNKKQAGLTIIASLLVLFSDVLNPIIPFILSVVILNSSDTWKSFKKRADNTTKKIKKMLP